MNTPGSSSQVQLRLTILIATKEYPKARVILLYTPISIKVASVKDDAPPTSLETKTANATDASMLCQQNVKTMYFQTLKPRLFKTVI